MRIRKLLKPLAAAAAAISVTFAAASTAHADTVVNGGWYSDVTQTTTSGYGEAQVAWVDSTGNYYVGDKNTPAFVEGVFEDVDTSFTLNAWVERSTDGGATWSYLSGIHALSSSSSPQNIWTYPYYDGPGYLARACFQFTSWSGAAVHCSAWI